MIPKIYSVGETIRYNSKIGKLKGKIDTIDALYGWAVIDGKQPKDIVYDPTIATSVKEVSENSLKYVLITLTSGAILDGRDVICSEEYDDVLRDSVCSAITNKVRKTTDQSLQLKNYSIRNMDFEFANNDKVLIGEADSQGEQRTYYSHSNVDGSCTLTDIEQMEIADLLALARDVCYANE